MSIKNIEQEVSDMYSRFPFPKRNEYGVDKMNQDFKENLEVLGLKLDDLRFKKVLDAGCGTGEISLFMARSGVFVDGVDISEGSLKFAYKKAQEEDLNNISFTKKSILDGEFRSQYYDYVVSHMVLHHTANAKRAFSNIAKSLKPGGGIIIRLFFLWGRMSIFQKSPLWKLWIVKFLGGNSSEKKVKLAERLFYKEGDEIPHGLDKYTYLHDCYGVPRVTHHTFGGVLHWLKENSIDYISSNPPLEFKKLVNSFVFNNKVSISKRGRLLKNVSRNILTVFPLHKAHWANCNSLRSRFLTQLLYMMFFGNPMFTIYGKKRTD